MTDETYLRDLRTRILQAIKESDPKAKGSRNAVEFKCPVHGGQTAWLRDYAWGCFVCGDTLDPKLVTLAGYLGVSVSAPGYAHRGYTVEDYADEKQFSVQDLLGWGVETIETDKEVPVVAFRCRDAGGRLVRTQVRSSKGKQWWLMDGNTVHPYGLDFLAKEVDMNRPVFLVEGVSDVHALMSMGYLAVGIPGATTWKSEWASNFAGRRELYLWREPGQAGEQFEQKVASDLPRIRILPGEKLGHKDPADMRKKLGNEVAAAKLDTAMQLAAPVGVRPLEISYTSIGGSALSNLGERLIAPIEAVATPFPMWNDNCRMFGGRVGLARGWYVLIAGGSGLGKTYTASSIVAHAARSGHRVAFHSLEMGWDELTLRMVSQISDVPIRELEPGPYHKPDAFHTAMKRVNERLALSGGDIKLNDRPLYRLDHLLDSMRYHYEVHGCIVHVVDYLQLAWVGDADSMQKQIIEVSHSVRALTKELRLVTIGLSQFNRDTSSQREVRPTKEGMLGGSALENDSDQSILLDHSRQTRNEWGWSTWLLIDKNRHGPQVDVPVQFNTATLTMRERMPDEVGVNNEMPEVPVRRRVR